MAENGTNNPDLLTAWRFEYGVRLVVPDVAVSPETVNTLPEYRRSDD
jgi:hypothetical protein